MDCNAPPEMERGAERSHPLNAPNSIPLSLATEQYPDIRNTASRRRASRNAPVVIECEPLDKLDKGSRFCRWCASPITSNGAAVAQYFCGARCTASFAAMSARCGYGSVEYRARSQRKLPGTPSAISLPKLRFLEAGDAA